MRLSFDWGNLDAINLHCVVVSAGMTLNTATSQPRCILNESLRKRASRST